MKMIGSRQENSAPVKLHLPWLVRYTGFRSCYPRARSDISVVIAIENQDFVSIRHSEQISFGIDGESHHVAELGLRSLDDANWRRVSVRVPSKNVDASSRKARDENLPILQIQTDGVRRHQMRVRPLNHAQRMLGTPLAPARNTRTASAKAFGATISSRTGSYASP